MNPEKFVELRDRIARLNASAIAKAQAVKNAVESFAKAEATFKPPEGVQSAAARGLELRAKWKRGGLTNAEASAQGIGSGVQRATNLKNGDAISLSTVKMMHAFFARHQKNYRPDEKADDGGPTAGTIAWLLWGGNAGKAWADGIVSRIQKDEGGSAPASSAPSSSASAASPSASDVHVATTDWEKPKAPKKKKVEKEAVISDAILQALDGKAQAHNTKAVHKASAEALHEVYKRGMAAYTTNATVSQGVFAMGRVNAFLKLLRKGKPETPAYVQDNDLLPPDHPANKE